MGWSPLDINKPRAKQYIGDEADDAISECFAEVCRLTKRDWNRKLESEPTSNRHVTRPHRFQRRAGDETIRFRRTWWRHAEDRFRSYRQSTHRRRIL